MRVSWWRWRLGQGALLALASVTVVRWTLADGTAGPGLTVAVYVALWGSTLVTAATSAELTERELVVRAPLCVERIPLRDVVLTRRRSFPIARIGRRGRWLLAWEVPYTSDTRRLFLAVENARR